MNNAYIVGTGKFLPNAPIANDEMEQYLGMINNKPSHARPIVLRRNGIVSRYYALDKNGNATHTNVQLAANSIRNLLSDSGLSAEDIDLYACGTSTPEQLIPSHGVMVHGALRAQRDAEVVSFAGSCCTGVDALKYAQMSVLLGNSRNAVVSASERSSAWLRASYFQTETISTDDLASDPMLSFNKEFLRWMLSDGAFALLLQPEPKPSATSLRIDWIEITSYANEKPTCMYAGGEVNADGGVDGWASYPQQEWLSKSLFAVKQDTRLLGSNIVELGCQQMLSVASKHHFTADEVDWYLPHLSSMYFKDRILEKMKEVDFYIPEDRWFLNLPHIGNIASASAFAMIDGLLHSGKLQRGQKILVMVPESARFSFCHLMLTVC